MHTTLLTILFGALSAVEIQEFFYKQEFLSSFKQFLPHPVMATHCDMIFHSFSFPSALFADVLAQLHTSFPESGIFLSSFDLSDLLEDLELSRRSDALCKKQGAVNTKKGMKNVKPQEEKKYFSYLLKTFSFQFVDRCCVQTKSIIKF